MRGVGEGTSNLSLEWTASLPERWRSYDTFNLARRNLPFFVSTVSGFINYLSFFDDFPQKKIIPGKALLYRYRSPHS
jgi:ethanolamine ammonia-lyase large subunit